MSENKNELVESMTKVITNLPEDQKYETVNQVKESLKDLYKRLCDSFEADEEVDAALRESIIARRDEMSISELLTAYELLKTQVNDKIGRTLGPSMGMMTEEIRAQIAADARVESQQKSGGNVQILQQFGQTPTEGGLPFTAPPNVLQGVDALIKMGILIGDANDKAAHYSEDADVVDASDSDE